MDYICADDGPPTELETISALHFVERFAAINVTRHQDIVLPGGNAVGNMNKFDQFIGNSRDYPTALSYHCSTPGCTYTHVKREQIRRHETSCTAEKLEAHDRRKKFACVHPGCESSFDQSKGLRTHVGYMHSDWTPRACTGISSGYDPTILYQTKAQYRRHVKVAHSAHKVTACPVSECTSTTVFATRGGLDSHLEFVHRLTGKEKAQYFPRAALKWTPGSCPFPGCTRTKVIYKTRDYLRQHLKSEHGLEKRL